MPSLNKARKSSLEATLRGSAIPVSGTYVAGDFIFNTTGTSPMGWRCTAGGTPGTWIASGTDHIAHSESLDPDPIAAAAYQAVTSTVTGAVLGDFVEASFSLDLAGCSLHPYVSAANTVTTLIRNNTASLVNLGSGVLYVRVNKR